ncbi:hypothetical protein [Massilia cavernae]|nr:hypothetical protein [Massilia cavernae]
MASILLSGYRPGVVGFDDSGARRRIVETDDENGKGSCQHG